VITIPHMSVSEVEKLEFYFNKEDGVLDIAIFQTGGKTLFHIMVNGDDGKFPEIVRRYAKKRK
jgi:hypothetical protein